MAAGWGHCHLLTSDGELWSFGGNAHAQCGQTLSRSADPALQPLCAPFPSHRFRAVATGAAHTLAITQEGALVFFGSIGDAKLDPSLVPSGGGGGGGGGGKQPRADAVVSPVEVPLPASPIAVAAGDNHSLVLTREALYAWGFGQHAALGCRPFRTNASMPRVVDLEFPHQSPPSFIFAGMDMSGCIF